MGPSGCGKSTLLAAVSGSLSYHFRLRGDILLNGASLLDVPMEKRAVGIIFQDDLLFPHLSIGGNLEFAIAKETPAPERNRMVREALQIAGLEQLKDRDPATLSGGQRSRISLLRSLLAKPHTLLLDEPFSKLDQKLKAHIREFVFGQIRRMNIPALLVTHNPRDCPDGKIIDLAAE